MAAAFAAGAFPAGAFPWAALEAGALAAGAFALAAGWFAAGVLAAPSAGAPLPTSTGTGSLAAWPVVACATWTPVGLWFSAALLCSSQEFETASNSILVVIAQAPPAFPGKRHVSPGLCNRPSIYFIYSNM
ncbi:hypothetical protein DPM35_30260 [Mesorhizobium atlanticum]|uniref:Uncharacterized protein n=1 Tax=Mesorhizobium atlanticum TaxID=2233532 RepID=A0A330GHI3_9HYPH|nr:hypothetical protein DPM35_30260 [Mesorhizobium atlanticum]